MFGEKEKEAGMEVEGRRRRMESGEGVERNRRRKNEGAGREEGVDHVEVATCSPQAPVKGPTAIRIRGALSDRDG